MFRVEVWRLSRNTAGKNVMDNTKSIWNLRAAHAAVFAAPGGEGRELRAAGPRPAARPSTYLAIPRKDCDQEQRDEEKRYEVAACGCRCWFCPRCCVGRGLVLRRRLIPVLQTFTGLLMWTFTIDPTLFDSPAAAYQYVKSKRCISVIMRRLRKLGYLHSNRYFCVIEWQKKSEMPHFHILADATFIPFDVVCNRWNRFRPDQAGPVQGVRPGFGSVRFSAPKFHSVEHAARYACKYLIKHPEHGYPDWVFDLIDDGHEVHRYTTSRRFWGKTKPENKSDSVNDSEDQIDDDDVDDHVFVPIRKRLANCGKSSVILQLSDGIDYETGEVVTVRKFVAAIQCNVCEAAAIAGEVLPQGRRRFLANAIGVEKVIGHDRALRGCLSVWRLRFDERH